jgi:putative transposase
LRPENRILKAQLSGRLKLSDAERGVLGEIGHRLDVAQLTGFSADSVF